MLLRPLCWPAELTDHPLGELPSGVSDEFVETAPESETVGADSGCNLALGAALNVHRLEGTAQIDGVLREDRVDLVSQLHVPTDGPGTEVDGQADGFVDGRRASPECGEPFRCNVTAGLVRTNELGGPAELGLLTPRRTVALKVIRPGLG